MGAVIEGRSGVADQQIIEIKGVLQKVVRGRWEAQTGADPMTGIRCNEGSMRAAPRYCSAVCRNCALMAVDWLEGVSGLESRGDILAPKLVLLLIHISE